MAPMQRALAIQALFEELGIDFLANSEWAGSSPDLNPTENLGSITMDIGQVRRGTRAVQIAAKVFPTKSHEDRGKSSQ